MAEKKPDKRKDTDEGEQALSRPRPFWSGIIAFGLVSLPVSLFPANRGKALSLRMVDEDGTPLQRRYYCEQEGRILDNDEIIRGYPAGDDRFVIVGDDELESLAPNRTREIDLRRFVSLDEVNPVFFERGYFLAPDSDSTKAYRLLARSMEKAKRAGIATFVMRAKEYLIAIIAEQGILRAETLRFHDEIRSPEEVGLPALSSPGKALTRSFQAAIQALSANTLKRSLLADPAARRVQALAEEKIAAGDGVVAMPEEAGDEEQSNVIDLMQVLKDRMQGRPSPNGDGGRTRGASGGAKSLVSLSRDALYDRARDRGIPGRSKMNKQELAEALGGPE